MTDLHVVDAGADEADEVVDVIHAAFGARPYLDPPSSALHETRAAVAATLAEHGGLLARVGGRPAGALLFQPNGTELWLRRVGVDPRLQHRGVASSLVGCAEEVAAERGYDTVSLTARVELPATQQFWLRRGYLEASRSGPKIVYSKAIPVELDVPTADDTRDLGARLGAVLAAGDVVLLTGELGAGKTTLTQGVGQGLQVRGPVTSPTFVIARLHPSLVDGPPLVHVDAYRLGSADELDDLDLEMSLDDAVTVVEWGEGRAESLSVDRLDVVIRRHRGGDHDDSDGRHVKVTPVGPRWLGSSLGTSLRTALG
ncbi:MAG: tRNA (adenosine(37)-N6)-threonylcarbamoyltransferase complex ATPase subunit type 1 TsaE [Propionibacteriales bacterium]|nr:tRNA (adenosine(37)-N6)-threonylcarbamoyltransferase complex ATPase subunit type 1 TsaE [Propionibacteriales bacterium]